MKSVARSEDLESLALPAGAAGGTIRYFKIETYGVQLSLLRVEIQPGHGAPLHTHTYDELFVIHEELETALTAVLRIAGESASTAAQAPQFGE